MKEKVTAVMQRITFLEQDLELQKHILRAVPTGEAEQGRKVLSTIADIKEKIEACRLEIKALDPDEYARMVRFEEAAAAFKKAAEGREFVSVTDLNTSEACRIETVDGASFECLVKARDAAGEWLALTVDGEVMSLGADQVKG